MIQNKLPVLKNFKIQISVNNKIKILIDTCKQVEVLKYVKTHLHSQPGNKLNKWLNHSSVHTNSAIITGLTYHPHLRILSFYPTSIILLLFGPLFYHRRLSLLLLLLVITVTGEGD